MNADGWMYGAGPSDNRVAGKDLQHNRQTRTADELHEPVRKVTETRESGGPMKIKDIVKQVTATGNPFPSPGALLGGLSMGGILGDEHKEHEGHHHRKHGKHHHLEAEKARHEEAMKHHEHHLHKHHGRHYDSQHGHDDYKY